MEKVEYRCTTGNFPLCNGTILVLKISLLYSVSIITNFMIPNGDKKQTKNKLHNSKAWQTDRQTKKIHHTFSSTAGPRPTIPTILGMVIGGPSRFCTQLTFLMRSVVSLVRFPCLISRLSGLRVAIFGPLSKNNTGMAALCAGLPVTSN